VQSDPRLLYLYRRIDDPALFAIDIFVVLCRTLEALNVTPASVTDIFTTKGIIGAALATVMGVLTLAISMSFGNSPFGLIITLALGAVLAAEILRMSPAVRSIAG